MLLEWIWDWHFYDVEDELKTLQSEVIKRVETLFMKKYQGNKSAFAKACLCDEKTIRKILNREQFLSVNLAFRISRALDITMSELFEGLMLKK